MKRIILVFGVLLFAVSCSSIEKKTCAVDRCREEEIVKLTQVLDTWLEAIKNGQMDQFRKLAMTPTVEYIEDAVRNDPDPGKEVMLVRDMTKPYFTYRSYEFLQCRCGKERVRLDYKKSNQNQTVSFMSIMFHLEGEQWKVGSVLEALEYPLKKKDGKDYTIEDFKGNKWFEIK